VIRGTVRTGSKGRPAGRLVGMRVFDGRDGGTRVDLHLSDSQRAPGDIIAGTGSRNDLLPDSTRWMRCSMSQMNTAPKTTQNTIVNTHTAHCQGRNCTSVDHSPPVTSGSTNSPTTVQLTTRVDPIIGASFQGAGGVPMASGSRANRYHPG